VVGEFAILVGAAFRQRGARNPWFRCLHLAAIGIVAVEAVYHWNCPLTVWEWDLRALAGQEPGTQTFVERLVHWFFMDGSDAWAPWVYEYIHLGFGVLVLV